jgi:hypothetical protein
MSLDDLAQRREREMALESHVAGRREGASGSPRSDNLRPEGRGMEVCIRDLGGRAGEHT